MEKTPHEKKNLMNLLITNILNAYTKDTGLTVTEVRIQSEYAPGVLPQPTFYTVNSSIVLM